MNGGDGGREGFEPIDRGRREIEQARKSQSKRFIVSFLSSLAVVLMVFFLVAGGYAQVVATFSSVGGIQADIGELRGNNLALYPAVGESSNCPWNTPGTTTGPTGEEGRAQNPVSPQDMALPMLKADISSARIPGGYEFSLTKDIELPAPFTHDAFRISLQRNESQLPNPVSLPYDGTPSAQTSTGQFIKSVTMEANNATIASVVTPLQEGTGFDRTSGRRDLTHARIYLVEGETYNLEVVMNTVKTPFSFEADRAPNYVQQTAEAGVYIDWDQSGILGTTDEEYILGSGDGGSNGILTVSQDITVQDPGGNLQTGSTLMRVIMNVSGSVNDPDGDIPRGMVEDYTVVVVESMDDIPEPAQIGDVSLKTTGLKADFLDLRGGSLGSQLAIDDKYSDSSSASSGFPVFGSNPPPYGEFYIAATGAGENAKIRNASARIHFLGLTSLDASLLELDLEMINSSEANIATQRCPILEPAFLPAFTNVPYNVSPSTSFSVDYEIRNPGLDPLTQDVDVEFPEGNVQTTFTDTINSTSSKSYTDSLTAPASTGRYIVVVDPQSEPAAQSARQEIIVGNPPNFQVTIDGVSPDPVVAEDEVLEVQTTVTNTGDVNGTQEILFSLGGQVKAFQSRDIDGGASQTFNFSYTPEDGDAGASVPVNVSSEDDFDVQNVEVLESPEFTVNITGSNAPVDAGNDLVINAEVTNTGGYQDTQDILLDITNSAGTQTDVDNVTGLTLNPGESQNIQFTYTTSNIGDPPEVEGTVRSDDDTDTGIFVVEGQGAVFQVDDVTPRPSSGEPDDLIEFDAQITNVGSEAGTQDVELNITPSDTSVAPKPDVDNTSLTLNQGETQNVSLFYRLEDEDAPEIMGEVLTRNQTSGVKIDSDTANVSVAEPAFFQPTIVSQQNEPIEGDELGVEVQITNTGSLVGDGTVTLEVDTNQDGTYDKTADVQVIEGLSPGVSVTRTLDYTTETGDADAVDIRVRGYTTRRLAEDFESGGSQPAGWSFQNSAGVNSNTSNSGSYSAYTCCAAGSKVVSPGVNTTYYSDTGVVALDYWIRKGDDSFSEDPDSGGPDDLTVEYLDDTGSWQLIETLQPTSYADGEKITRIDQIVSAGAIHSNFQLRFNQTAATSGDWDYWHIDDVAVKSGDVDGTDTATGYTVLTPPFFDVTILGTNEPITAGGPLDVTVEINNTGTAEGTQTITLWDEENSIGQEDSTQVTIPGGGSIQRVLTWSTGTHDWSDDDTGSSFSTEISANSANTSDIAFPSINVPGVDPSAYGGQSAGTTSGIGIWSENIYIDNVILTEGTTTGGTTVIDSTCGDGNNGGYAECTGNRIYSKVNPGQSITAEVTTTGSWSGGDQEVHIYVDWDNDGSLADQTPLDMGNVAGTESSTFTVPSTASPGTYLLRVVGDGQDTSASWDESGWNGEKEDYRITVTE